MERYLRINLLGPSPRIMEKKHLPGRGLTEVEKQWHRATKGHSRLVSPDGKLCVGTPSQKAGWLSHIKHKSRVT